MAVKTSAEIIREMKKEIADTIKEIESISNGIRSGVRTTVNWDDQQAEQFKTLMQKTARLTEAPVDTLKAALPKLEKLAVAIDDYNKVKFR